MPCEQRVEPGSERFAACVHELFAGQLVEIVRLDGVHELPGLAGGGNHVEPPARGHLAAAGQAGQGRRNGIGAVEVIEQPSVESVGGERRLHGGDVEVHHASIAEPERAAGPSH